MRGSRNKKENKPRFLAREERQLKNLRLEGFEAQFLAQVLPLKSVGSTLNLVAELSALPIVVASI